MTMPDRSAGEPKSRQPGGLIVVIFAVLAASVMFRLLVAKQFNHTSMLFVGIPAMLAILVASIPTPRTATGLILKVMTLCLLLSGVLLGEAFICILMASPLFILVGVIIGGLIDFSRRRRDTRDRTTLGMMLLVLIPASLEGVVPGFEFERRQIVSAARIVEAPARAVATALAQTPRFDTNLPAFFKLGFPTPGATSGSGLEVGDRRTIALAHGRHPGTLVLQVQRSEPGHVRFVPTRDDSYLTHWMSWETSDVRWVEVAPGRTLVTWTLAYRRRLDPAWYFGPLERYGTRLAAGYLIDALAVPQPALAGLKPCATTDQRCEAASTPTGFGAAGDPFCSVIPGWLR